MKKLTKYVGAAIPYELHALLEKMCEKYRKSVNQAIRELIATAVGRVDLAGSFKTSSTQIQRHVRKADIAMIKIREDQPEGWTELIEAISDLIFLNQISLSNSYLINATRVASQAFPEGHGIRRDLASLKELWKMNRLSLEWDSSTTWNAGPPHSAGQYLIIDAKHNARLSNIEDEDHPDIRNSEAEWHLRIPGIPFNMKKDRLQLDSSA